MSISNLTKIHSTISVVCIKTNHKYSYTVHNGMLEWEVWRENSKGFKSKAQGSVLLSNDNEVNFTLKGIIEILEKKEL